MIASADLKVKWHCRRGMLELDLLLNHFFERFYFQCDPTEKALFNELLEKEDERLFAWFFGQSLPDAEYQKLCEKIKHGLLSAGDASL